jgi:hypothetical protein
MLQLHFQQVKDFQHPNRINHQINQLLRCNDKLKYKKIPIKFATPLHAEFKGPEICPMPEEAATFPPKFYA